ncbi:hypothetical protein PsorP6_014601 [Peronosclerospora sorghi]|uniref:Uncharacterized protein n=1 Tax=Peronosclerospora sorghi TaxID=230839 RepID=A0ACC0VTG3_9STRA|nr:hypothetical protein PsorP6_014601 [Peronosclerospora sorghi]
MPAREWLGLDEKARRPTQHVPTYLVYVRMDSVAVFKLVSIVCIWLVGLVGGLLPVVLALKPRSESSPVARLVNAFSGGVFLAGGFFHLLHAAIENPALRRWSTEDDGRYAFPYAEMFCTVGFLGLLLVEQAAQARLTTSHASTYAYVAATSEDEDAREADATETSGTYVEEMDDEGQGLTRVRVGDKKAEHEAKAASFAVALVLFLALSFHSVLEGLGIGAQTETAWSVFGAIVLHKGLAAFALGSGLVQSAMPRGHVVLHMVVFSFMSILGILLGWILAADASTEDSAAAGICVALASGTFIYVAVMEVIPQEFARHSHGEGGHRRHEYEQKARVFQKSCALVAGYAIFGLLAKWS